MPDHIETDIEKRIDELENRRFLLNMKDMWSPSDYSLDSRLANDIRELRKMLKEENKQ